MIIIIVITLPSLQCIYFSTHFSDYICNYFNILPAAISWIISSSASSLVFASDFNSESSRKGWCRDVISGFRLARFFDFFFFRSELEIFPFVPDSFAKHGAILTKSKRENFQNYMYVFVDDVQRSWKFFGKFCWKYIIVFKNL